MRKELVLLVFFILGLSLQAQTEEIVLNLDCSIFQVSASKDMSESNAPHNWQSVCDLNWQSTSVFAQSVTEGNMSFLGKAVRFGSLKSGDGKATLASVDLSKTKNQKVVLRISVSSGADKSGKLDIRVDGKSIGTIAASDGNNGRSFGREYYPFEFEIKNGKNISEITIEHSSTDNKGFIYMNQFAIVKINK
ncbi:MAG: hypothetical protein VB046_13810 [Paludibacter sp.]|nr:hypothetical protein [Paludibacter sp.]